MHHVTQMLEAHPQATPSEALARCIGACFACAQTCTSCADACLGEKEVQELVRCIRLNLDCAEVCEATGRVLTRQTSFEPRLARTTLEACAQSCRICAEECERHAQEMNMEHCRICAEACRRCERACNDLLSSIGAERKAADAVAATNLQLRVRRFSAFSQSGMLSLGPWRELRRSPPAG